MKNPRMTSAKPIAKALDGREAGGGWMPRCPGFALLVGWPRLDPVVEPMRAERYSVLLCWSHD